MKTIRASLSLLVLLSGFWLASACVSVSVGQKHGGKASDVSYAEPAKPFESISSPDADKAWQNRATGSTISYQSSCNDPADPSLEEMESELLSALTNTKIVQTANPFFDGRESRKTIAEGTVEGLPAKIEVVVFKKNSCAYCITYFSVSKHFSDSQLQFERFLEGFKAP